MTRVLLKDAGPGEGLSAVRSTFGAIHALRPKIAASVESAQRSLYVDGTLPARLRELVRLRIGFHNQCRTCMAVRYAPDSVPESLVCALESPQEVNDLTDAERAAIQFADLFATDHVAIDDAAYERLRAHFDEGEIVELGFLCAIFVGTGRLAATWNVTESLPRSFQEAEGVVTPWGHDAVLALRRNE
jgi:alkylhydroperoxidase family enzyme